MSGGMTSRRITIRVSKSLVRRLKQRARMKGSTESALVREALENYLPEAQTSTSAYVMAREVGLIGCVSGAASDLSHHAGRKHAFRIIP